MAPLLKKIFFSFVTILLLLFLLEGSLRLAGYKPKTIPFMIFSGNPERAMAESGQDYSGRLNTIFLTDEAAFWKFKPGDLLKMEHPNDFLNSYQINSKGFRGKEFTDQKNPGVFRILAIGDSITFGLFIPEEKTYFKLLEEKLNQTFAPLKFEVISVGIPGYTSYQGRQLLEKELLAYSPDAVIAYFGGNNEFSRSFYTDREYAALMNSSLEKLSKKIYAVNLLASTIKRLMPADNDKSKQTKLRVPPTDFSDDLVEIAKFTAQSNIALILVIPPHSTKNEPIAEEYSSLVRTFKGALSLADIDEAFKQQGADALFASDNVHPNEAGHQVIAEKIYEIIVEKTQQASQNATSTP